MRSFSETARLLSPQAARHQEYAESRRPGAVPIAVEREARQRRGRGEDQHIEAEDGGGGFVAPAFGEDEFGEENREREADAEDDEDG